MKTIPTSLTPHIVHRAFLTPLSCLLFLLLALAPPATVRAETKYWDGSANGNWSTAANWVDNIAPVAGDRLIFPPNISRLNVTNDFGASRVFDSVIFEGTGYVIYGASLALMNGISAQHASGVNIVRADVDLRANQTIACLNAGTTLTLGSSGLSVGVALGTYTLTVDGAGRIETRDWITGAGGVIKNGPGTLVYFTYNTYTGDTVVNAGVLEFSMNRVHVANYINGRLIIGDGVGGVETDVVRTGEWNKIADASAIIINSSGLLDLDGANETIGPLTMSGGTIRTGTGTLTLDADVTVRPGSSGSWITGRVAPGSTSRTFHLAEYASSLQIDADIGGTADLIKTGPGVLSLGGSNSYTGTMFVQQGRLSVRNSFALGTTDSPTIVSDGAALILNGAQVGFERLELNGSGWSSYFRTLNCHNFSNSWAGPITVANGVVIKVVGDPLNLSGAISGTGGLTKDGEGPLTLSGPAQNTYGGTTFVSAGTLILGKSSTAIAVPGDLTIGDETGPDNVLFARAASANQIANSATVTCGGNGLLGLDGATETIGALAGRGMVYLNGGLLVTGGNNASTTYSGGIARGTGNGRLTKTGTGTLTLTRNNEYTGLTTVSGGTLVVNGSQPSSPVLMAGGTLSGVGVVGNLTVSSGTVAPGNRLGRLTCGNVNFANSGRFMVELGGPPASTDRDELSAVGTVNLGNAALHVSLDYAPREGDQFVILRNDGTADPNVNTFAGLPNGSIVTADGLQFRLAYNGGDGNDVVLTLINVGLRHSETIVTAGNGNGKVDRNECNLLSVVLINTSAAVVRGVTATLIPKSPGVSVTAGSSAYPDVLPEGRIANSAPFQITTWPGMACGTSLDFELLVQTATHGTFRVPLQLPAGAPARPQSFSNNQPIPTAGSPPVSSTVTVSGFTAPVGKVTVSLHVEHPVAAALALYLMAPDGTGVVLTSNNGGPIQGGGYGNSCGARTMFDDDATVPITFGIAPFLGRYRPEGRLSDFQRLGAAAANGQWQLLINDNYPGANGILQCWTLTLYPAGCPDGGGACELAGDRTIPGSLSSSSQTQQGRLSLSGSPSTCASRQPCPGATVSGQRRFDAYTFLNGDSAACVSVTLSASCPMFSATYLNPFNPSSPCENYLADSGNSMASGGTVTYSFNVPARERFVVVVNEVEANTGCDYTLVVTGASAYRPEISARHAGSGKMAVEWSTAALGYQLESSPDVEHSPWVRMIAQPIVVNSRNTLTNNTGTIPVNSTGCKSHEPGACRSCWWLLPLLPRREERAGERRAVTSARNSDPNNSLGMVRQEKASGVEGESPSRLNMNDNTKT